jgi:ubiquinone/menaquinone biosynthesis C-methylase UbiE
MTDHTPAADSVVEEVRARYAAAARAVIDKQAGPCCESGLGASQYDTAELDRLPADAVRASLGCGNPTAVADLHEGETVLDLGSGGGIDVLLSGRRVGPTGNAYGLDMTDEMLDLARRNTAVAGATNVEFLKGRMEEIPLPDTSVDVVISNCVVNLSPNKPAVFAEIYRVLKPGGRIGISDLVADDHLTTEDRARMGAHADCIAGALTYAEYTSLLIAAGFSDVTLTRSHAVMDGLQSTVIRATKAAT